MRLLGDEVQLIPEFSESLVEEGDCALGLDLSEGGEHEFIDELLLGLQREVVVAVEVLSLNGHFEVGCLVQRVLYQDLEDDRLPHLGQQLHLLLIAGSLGIDHYGVPDELLPHTVPFVEGQTPSVDPAEFGTQLEWEVKGAARLESDGHVVRLETGEVGLEFIGDWPVLVGVVEVDGLGDALSGDAVDHQVVQSEGLFPYAHQVVLELVVVQRVRENEFALLLAGDQGSEGDDVVGRSLLLDVEVLGPGEVEFLAVGALEGRVLVVDQVLLPHPLHLDHPVLRVRVVHHWNLLSHLVSHRHLHLQSRPHHLRVHRHWHFQHPDVCLGVVHQHQEVGRIFECTLEVELEVDLIR